MKKLLSVVISMCLLFSALSFPTAVTAETVTPEQETTLVTESTDVTLQENSEETTESTMAAVYVEDAEEDTIYRYLGNTKAYPHENICIRTHEVPGNS